MLAVLLLCVVAVGVAASPLEDRSANGGDDEDSSS